MGSALRFLRILAVGVRYGLYTLAPSSGFWPRLVPFAGILLGADTRSPRGRRVREALETLGPIFVKFGQVLSTRRDLLPLDVADELAHLQDRVPPFDPE